MLDKPLIGIMFDSSRLLTSIRKYIKYSKNSSLVFSFTPADIDWDRLTIKGTHLENKNWIVSEFSFPVVVYNRCFTTKTRVVKKLESFIGKDKIFNYVNRFDKWSVYEALCNTSVDQFQPKTYLYSNSSLHKILNLHGCLYLKPCVGFKGQKIYRIETNHKRHNTIYFSHYATNKVCKNKDVFIKTLDNLINGKAYIVQQEIPMLLIKDRHFDIRVIVQKDKKGSWKVSGNLSRFSYPYYFITNFCNKICTAEEALDEVNMDSRIILDKLYNISLNAAKVLEGKVGLIGEISVDFGIDKNGRPWIIEINGKPDKSLFKKLNNREIIKTIFSRPMEYAYYLCKK